MNWRHVGNAVLEALAEGSPERETLAATIAALSSVSGTCEELASRATTAGGRPQSFAIGGDVDVDEGAGTDDDGSDWEDSTGWEGDGRGHGGGSNRNYAHGGASWGGGGHDHDDDQYHWHQRAAWGGAAGWDNGQWGGATWTPQVGGQGASLEGRSAIATGSADAWASDEERSRAERAYALQQAAEGATAGAGFATAAAAAASGQVHAIRVAEVKRMADENGVSYEGVNLDLATPQEVEEFVRSFLE